MLTKTVKRNRNQVRTCNADLSNFYLDLVEYLILKKKKQIEEELNLQSQELALK